MSFFICSSQAIFNMFFSLMRMRTSKPEGGLKPLASELKGPDLRRDVLGNYRCSGTARFFTFV
jgi:hypothetical protein